MKGFRFAYAAKESGLMKEISTHFEKKERGWLDTDDPDAKVFTSSRRNADGLQAVFQDCRRRKNRFRLPP